MPSWTRQMESVRGLRPPRGPAPGLSLRPYDYVRRQVQFTPYPTEDVGWIIEQSGPEVCLFSSDYPHVEGGRRPIERSRRRWPRPGARAGVSGAERRAFYTDNFADLMGGGRGARPGLTRRPCLTTN